MPTMSTPRSVAQDLASAKHRRDELGETAIGAVGEGAAMRLAERLDVRVAVVHRVVAVAWTTRSGGDDPQVAPANEDLRVARPAIVLRASSLPMVTVEISVPSTTHDSRRSVGWSWVDRAANRRVMVETIRCAARRGGEAMGHGRQPTAGHGGEHEHARGRHPPVIGQV
jgi:hypothetical protein